MGHIEKSIWPLDTQNVGQAIVQHRSQWLTTVLKVYIFMTACLVVLSSDAYEFQAIFTIRKLFNVVTLANCRIIGGCLSSV